MGMPLRRLVPLLALLLSLFSMAVASRALVAEWTRLHDADRAGLALADLKTALVAAEMASRERGPSAPRSPRTRPRGRPPRSSATDSAARSHGTSVRLCFRHQVWD